MKNTAYDEVVDEIAYSSGGSDGLFVAAYKKLSRKDRKIRIMFLWRKLFLKASAASKILGAL